MNAEIIEKLKRIDWSSNRTRPDHKDINADHSVSAGEVLDRIGLLQTLGITNPTPNPEQERSIEHD